MAITYSLIQAVNVTASGGVSSIVFSNIPQTFTDLCLLTSIAHDRSSNKVTAIRFNGDTGANYLWRIAEGYGSGFTSFSQNVSAGYNTLAFSYCNDPAYTANVFANGMLYFSDYTSNANKSSLTDSVTENDATSALMGFGSNRWANSSAITSITLLPDPNGAAGTVMVQNSSASLYGIKRN